MGNNILYYSDVCPDTKSFLNELNRLEVRFKSVNITESISNLKEFLAVRDNEAVFNDKKETNQVGIPVLVTEDKEYLFDGEQLRNKFDN
ncbi:glutaredoxin [Ruoffia tabacinasalis]|uniref:glutaredoxin n=1 Tax=Ruoffia tabacinasalis TaxID=87458 RepID=UPI0030CF3D4E